MSSASPRRSPGRSCSFLAAPEAFRSSLPPQRSLLSRSTETQRFSATSWCPPSFSKPTFPSGLDPATIIDGSTESAGMLLPSLRRGGIRGKVEHLPERERLRDGPGGGGAERGDPGGGGGCRG